MYVRYSGLYEWIAVQLKIQISQGSAAADLM